MDPSTPRNRHLERVAQSALAEVLLSLSPSPSPAPGTLSSSPPALPPPVSLSPSPTPRSLSSTPISRTRMASEGNRADGRFKPQAWSYAQKKVQELSSRPITIEQCKGKVDTCKKEWQIWAQLRQQSGFSVVDGVVVADEGALAEYFVAHPKAERYRDFALPFEDLHRELFEGYYATGEAASSIDRLLASQVADSIEDSDPQSLSTDIDSGNESQGRKRAATMAAERREKRTRKLTAKDQIGMRLDNIARQIRELATAFKTRDYQ
ncbi:hypothetical protein BU23DRAFT_574585 [Bimuria novae-zelandiae CBS 107.79]|uniref:Myb/SANT-like domain-containing protein n=1 Tax=Bimuria novae-zelandiae CBS 107.79 TaxID=1447943 RepID=A0A6A5UP87_9PLEO|nr:hypothetical protein BU23DRAFT_574585 [Bimuria novae-zelandiae CBS 107.79]